MHQAFLNRQQQEGRARNAVADLLQRRLIVPKIYFEAIWPQTGNRADVLAIDRAGAGEMHWVEVKTSLDVALQSLPILKSLPAHFKYLAVPEELQLAPGPDWYALDGMGRVGLITFRELGSEEMVAEFKLRPERFRQKPEIFDQIDAFTAKHRPDWEIRD